MNRDNLIDSLRILLTTASDLRDSIQPQANPSLVDQEVVEKFLRLKTDFDSVQKVVYQVEYSTFLKAEQAYKNR